MKMSANGMCKLRTLEGWRSIAYLDSGGVATIGYGHVIRGNEQYLLSTEIDKEFGVLLLLEDVSIAENAVDTYIGVELTQCQYDALVMFVFNVGTSAFRLSTLRKKLNAGLYAHVPNELRRWIYVKSKPSKGLERRREAEIGVWSGHY